MSLEQDNAIGAGSMSRPERIFAGGVFVLGALGTCLILVLAGLIIADVLGRDLFGQAVPGVPELVAMSMVSIVFLQLPYALRAERLTRNGSFIEALCERRPFVGHLLEMIFSLFGAVVFGMVVYTTFPYFLFAWESDQYAGGVAGFFVPVWPVKAVIIVGSAAMALQFLIRTISHLRLAVAPRIS